MSERPKIPAEMERRVLVEAGHRCAIPTCRAIHVDVHHIVPWEACQKHEYENLIALCTYCHRRTHKGEIDRKALRIYKANLRFAHDKYSQFEMGFLFEAYRLKGQTIAFPSFMILIIKRLLDSNFLNRQQTSGGVFVSGMNINPDFYSITVSGQQFIESFMLDHEN